MMILTVELIVPDHQAEELRAELEWAWEQRVTVAVQTPIDAFEVRPIGGARLRERRVPEFQA